MSTTSPRGQHPPTTRTVFSPPHTSLEAHQTKTTKAILTRISRQYLANCTAHILHYRALLSHFFTPSPVATWALKLGTISKLVLVSLGLLSPCQLPGFKSSKPGTHAGGSPAACDTVSKAVISGLASGNTASGLSAGPISNTRSNKQDPDDERPPEDEPKLTRTFNPYDHLKSVSEVNESIKAELLKPLPTTVGYIYGFLHPRTLVRMGTGPALVTQVIKIGRTVNVKRRMKQWKKQCKYEPCVVLTEKMPHHERIERILHHQLHNSRLREFRCPGCGHQHNEWFRVNTIYAEHLVGMWRDFAHRQPYDRLGGLLPDWLERLEHVDLEDPGCWMWFILGPPFLEPENTDETSEELEGSSSILPGLSGGQNPMGRRAR